jgi:hypothetical protein
LDIIAILLTEGSGIKPVKETREGSREARAEGWLRVVLEAKFFDRAWGCGMYADANLVRDVAAALHDR